MKPEGSASAQLSKADVERILGEPIESFTTSSGSKEGDNVAGDLLAIKVIRKGDPKPFHVLYKAIPSNAAPEQRQYIVQFGIFHTETCMYEKIIPRIEALLQKKEKVQRKTIPVAKYISGFNDDTNDYVCLEDLRPLGFQMQDKFHSLTVAEVTLVMKEIGRFHACTNFLLRYDGERLFEEDKRMHRIQNSPFTAENPVMTEFFARMNLAFLENTVELLEPRDKELAKHVQAYVDKTNHKQLAEIIRFNANRTDKSVFPCIVHGDLWTNNILFKYSKEGDRSTPEELRFIDFQVSRRGCIYEDLGYFFWTSTTPEFRKQNLDKMLNVYYNSFKATLEELGFPIPVGFTRGNFVDGFYAGMLPAYLYMPFALGLQMGNLKYMKDPDQPTGQTETEGNGKDDQKPKEPQAPTGPPDFTVMVASEKKLHKLRMMHSPRALERLEILTREIVEMKLL